MIDRRSETTVLLQAWFQLIILLTATRLPGTGCSSSSSEKCSDTDAADDALHTNAASAQAASQREMMRTMRHGAVLIDHVHAVMIAHTATAGVQCTVCAFGRPAVCLLLCEEIWR
jgi:hypothetical protein